MVGTFNWGRQLLYSHPCTCTIICWQLDKLPYGHCRLGMDGMLVAVAPSADKYEVAAVQAGCMLGPLHARCKCVAWTGWLPA